jgi:hypothetical protein
VELRRCEQQDDAAAVPAEAGDVQWRAASGRIAQVRVRAALQQQPRGMSAAALASENHGGVPFGICHINVVTTLVQQLPDTFEAAARERTAHQRVEQRVLRSGLSSSHVIFLP